MPDALAEPFSHMSLPDLLILIRPGVNLLHLSRCLRVFSYVLIVVHISFSLIHTLFTLWQTYLVSLGTAVMTLRHSYSCFFSNAGWSFSASKTNRLWFDHESYDGTLEKGKASFLLKTNCWDLWAVENPCDDFFFGFFPTNLEWWRVFIWFFYGGLGGWLMTGFQKQVPEVPCSDFTTIFTHVHTYQVGSRNHHKQEQREPPWTPQKQACKKWLFQSIGWWTEPIGTCRKYAWRNPPNFQKPSIGKKRTDWDFRCSRAGQGFQVWAVTEIGCAVIGSARPRWCHEGWDPRGLRSGGEEVQSGSRDGLLNGSPDGWFSCSKTADSAQQAITWFSIFGDYIYFRGNKIICIYQV